MVFSTIASATTTTSAVATATTASSASVITSFAFNPLTTTFTPPADCSGIYYQSELYVVDYSTSCLPPGFQLSSTDYFSPGIVCPAGYFSACHDTTGVVSITTVTCCPTQGDITLSCADHTEARWAPFHCTWIPDVATFVAVTLSDNGETSTSNAAFASPGGLNAYGVRMVYESTDLMTSTSSSSTLTTSSTISITTSTPSASTGSSTGSSTESPTGSPTGSSLSKSGVIAVAVVVPLVAIFLLASVFIWRKRQRNVYTRAEGHGVEPNELPAESISADSVELWGGQVKVPAAEPPSELLAPLTSIPVELSTETEKNASRH
ncbi:hypothetical protein BP6252_13037 [Coleophoma cylindrospora]|uniref:Mid2 domain-containing protein n=1 Tax=Coleophoma cylindrospora TaxID=1849047 RepID=A0A3D8QE62_9HELO|nr:hypothetical protein BP6252_13037 [Coleophoma cylindrospora]